MRYVFSYDLENPNYCLQAAPILARLHRERGIPATFFIVGRLLAEHGATLKAIFGDDPLFELQSHTMTHALLADSQMHGPGVSLEQAHDEIVRSKAAIEQTFDRPCTGLRCAFCFERGMQDKPDRVALFAAAGLDYISSDARGPADSIPSGLQQAYWYDQEGQPGLLELPAHGWHDNVLKLIGRPEWCCGAWPPYFAWGTPAQAPTTPEEEVAVQAVWLDKAVEWGLDYVSLVYHPWSIFRFSPDCRSMALLMDALAARGVACTTYGQLHAQYAAGQPAPGREVGRWEPVG